MDTDGTKTYEIHRGGSKEIVEAIASHPLSAALWAFPSLFEDCNDIELKRSWYGGWIIILSSEFSPVPEFLEIKLLED